ncbi:hypothetical protein LTS17_000684 [Exophiala oligosperma]
MMAASNRTYNGHIERLRHREYPSLLTTTYLDHAGTTLYAKSFIDAYHRDLTSNLYGNPHSESPASWLATERVEDARLAVLDYFHACPDEFDVVFTANATAAIKVVSDCFRDQGFWYGFHKDCHNSLVGVREVATKGSRCFTSDTEIEEWISQRTPSPSAGLRLFAYPAQSNMTGYRPPLEWPQRIRSPHSGSDQLNFVLLDAASYLTTGRLDLTDSEQAPDFITMSFYKIFGYPDLGALIVKKSARDALSRRKYFAGGTVDMVTVIGGAFHVFKGTNIHDFLEDGTVPFHNIVALGHAIQAQNQLFGSAVTISNHAACLSKWLFDELSHLRHANGEPVVIMHKDEGATYGDTQTQGPIIAFNIKKADGTIVWKSHFETLAIASGFQLRTGGVCNPGGIASMLTLKHWELRRNYEEGARCGDGIDVIGAKSTGIIRVSLGAMSTHGDVERFANFVRSFFVDITSPHTSSTTCVAVTNISALEGCPPMTVDPSEYAAYQVWDRRWFILDPATGEKIDKVKDFGVKIDVQTGELVLKYGDGRLAIGLWDVPSPTDDRLSTPSERIFDTYDDSTINDWLSERIGVECKLCYYRPQDPALLPEATTCAVASCGWRGADKTDLGHHYKWHAETFLATRPFGAPKAAPLVTTPAPRRAKYQGQSATARRCCWLLNLKSVFERSRAKKSHPHKLDSASVSEKSTTGPASTSPPGSIVGTKHEENY